MYNESLAAIHDDGFGFYAKAAAQSMKDRLTPPPSSLLELGCGSGIFGDELGMDLTYCGIDISSQMTNLAAQRLARFSPVLKTGSIYDMEFEAVDLIAAVGEILNYCVDEESGADTDYFLARLSNLFGKARAALSESGFFLFDVILRRGPESLAAKTYFDTDDWSVLVEADRQGDFLRRKIITYEQEASHLFKKDVEIHTLYLYELEKVGELLAKTGFDYEVLERYGDFELAPNRAGFLCRPV